MLYSRSCCLSILHIIVCICYSQTPNSPLPTPHLGNHKCAVCLSDCSCFTDKFIWVHTLFLWNWHKPLKVVWESIWNNVKWTNGFPLHTQCKWYSFPLFEIIWEMTLAQRNDTKVIHSENIYISLSCNIFTLLSPVKEGQVWNKTINTYLALYVSFGRCTWDIYSLQ